jgi:hypothetical protein
VLATAKTTHVISRIHLFAEIAFFSCNLVDPQEVRDRDAVAGGIFAAASEERHPHGGWQFLVVEGGVTDSGETIGMSFFKLHGLLIYCLKDEQVIFKENRCQNLQGRSSISLL